MGRKAKAPKPQRLAMTSNDDITEGCIGYDGKDLYIEYAGKRIAIRSQEKKWIPLVHGVSVLDVDGGDGIEIQFFNESASGALM